MTVRAHKILHTRNYTVGYRTATKGERGHSRVQGDSKRPTERQRRLAGAATESLQGARKMKARLSCCWGKLLDQS